MQTLIYCYDAYCGWCYGFSKIILQLTNDYKDKLFAEVLSGGMVLPERPVHIGVTAPYIQEAYKEVEGRCGVSFGSDYLWHINHADESDWYPNSEKPAIAMCILKEIYPGRQVEFAADLQYALHFEGRDLTDDEAYRHLLEKYEIDAEGFYGKLHAPEYREKAHYEFALVKQLKVTGFPTVFLQASDSRFYLAARGYTSYEQFTRQIQSVLKEIETTEIK